ncbi:hypothetical protein Tco_0174598 [Tanacetum coccineum]
MLGVLYEDDHDLREILGIGLVLGVHVNSLKDEEEESNRCWGPPGLWGPPPAKGVAENSLGKGLAISMVDEAWLSEKKEVCCGLKTKEWFSSNERMFLVDEEKNVRRRV